MEYVEYSSNMCYPANKDIPFFGLTANPDNYRNILGPRLYKKCQGTAKEPTQWHLGSGSYLYFVLMNL